MPFKNLILIVSTFLSISGCAKKDAISTDNNVIFKPSTNLRTFTYLALGDSYTIGESVPQNSSFPYQLAQTLKTDSINIAEPKIIAKTGWTTDELISAIKTANITSKFDFVTLLIGVNNQYRNYDTVTYRQEFKTLLQTAIAYASNHEEKVFILSIPDWGVTPFGQSSGKSTAQIAKEIDFYNAINKEETAKTKANYLDITPISREASTNKNLVADDGLHPSAQMYALWVAQLKKQVQAQLK